MLRGLCPQNKFWGYKKQMSTFVDIGSTIVRFSYVCEGRQSPFAAPDFNLGEQAGHAVVSASSSSSSGSPVAIRIFRCSCS